MKINDDRVIKGKFKKDDNNKVKRSVTKFNIFNKLKYQYMRFFVNKSSIIVCEMQLNTGDRTLIPVRVRNGSFKLFGKRYLVDDKYLVYYTTFKMWGSFYHEDISIPISQSIDKNKIKTTIDRNSVEENVVNNLDPETLENFTKSTVIQKVFAGAELNNLFNFMKMLLIVNTLGIAICCVAVLNLVGVF